MFSALSSAKAGLTTLCSKVAAQVTNNPVAKNVNAVVNSVKPFSISLYYHRNAIYEMMKRNVKAYSIEAFGLLGSLTFNQHFKEKNATEKLVLELVKSSGVFFGSIPFPMDDRVSLGWGVMEGNFVESINSVGFIDSGLRTWMNAAFLTNYIFAEFFLRNENGLQDIMTHFTNMGKLGLVGLGFSSGGPLGAAAALLGFETGKDVLATVIQHFSHAFTTERTRLA